VSVCDNLLFRKEGREMCDYCQKCGEEITDENRAIVPMADGPEDVIDVQLCNVCAATIEEGGKYHE